MNSAQASSLNSYHQGSSGYGTPRQSSTLLLIKPGKACDLAYGGAQQDRSMRLILNLFSNGGAPVGLEALREVFLDSIVLALGLGIEVWLVGGVKFTAPVMN
jgi:hypothetical protein